MEEISTLSMMNDVGGGGGYTLDNPDFGREKIHMTLDFLFLCSCFLNYYSYY